MAPHFTPDFTSHEPVRDLVTLLGKFAVRVDRVDPGSTPERRVVVAHSGRPGTPLDAKMQIME